MDASDERPSDGIPAGALRSGVLRLRAFGAPLSPSTARLRRSAQDDTVEALRAG